MALIVIKKSKDSAISKRMLELAKTGDTVLLVQDGVFTRSKRKPNKL